MKRIVIGLVVVIIALGGFEVAKSQDLKQIQDKFKREVEHYLLELSVSPKNVNKIRFTKFRVILDEDDPEVIILSTFNIDYEEFESFTQDPGYKFMTALCCKIAKKYHERTGLSFVKAGFRYRVVPADADSSLVLDQSYGFRRGDYYFDGTNCY